MGYFQGQNAFFWGEGISIILQLYIIMSPSLLANVPVNCCSNPIETWGSHYHSSGASGASGGFQLIC